MFAGKILRDFSTSDPLHRCKYPGSVTDRPPAALHNSRISQICIYLSSLIARARAQRILWGRAVRWFSNTSLTFCRTMANIVRRTSFRLSLKRCVTLRWNTRLVASSTYSYLAREISFGSARLWSNFRENQCKKIDIKNSCFKKKNPFFFYFYFSEII